MQHCLAKNYPYFSAISPTVGPRLAISSNAKAGRVLTTALRPKKSASDVPWQIHRLAEVNNKRTGTSASIIDVEVGSLGLEILDDSLENPFDLSCLYKFVTHVRRNRISDIRAHNCHI